MSSLFDCIIVGAGPSGLTAAVYLGRFLRSVLVLHNGQSRAALIPTSHNYPGFVGGVSGTELLTALRQQACSYGAEIESDTVLELMRRDGVFFVNTANAQFRAANVILATGIVDHNIPVVGLRGAIYDGQLRFCPICDGYEVIDKRVCVCGPFEAALHKALFLRSYSKDVTIIYSDLADQARAADANIKIVRGDVVEVRRDSSISVIVRSGDIFTFDVLYPALGYAPRSDLAIQLGAKVDREGSIIVDAHQRTSVEGGVDPVRPDTRRVEIGRRYTLSVNDIPVGNAGERSCSPQSSRRSWLVRRERRGLQPNEHSLV